MASSVSAAQRHPLEIDNAILIRTATDASATAIVFSSVNSNSFSYYNMFEKFEDRLNRIYVRDPADLWYNKGISEEVSSIDALSAHLRTILDELKPVPVMTFGSSMGGYAAILFGHLLGVDRVAAISPQTILDSRLPHTPSADLPAAYRDLRPIAEADGCARGALFFGAADFVDIYNVTRVAWPGFDVFPIVDQDHLVAQHLTRSRVMGAFVEAFAAGREPFGMMMPKLENQIDWRCRDRLLQELVRRVVEGFYLGAGWPSERYLRAILALDDQWAAAAHVLSLVYRKAGRVDEAVEQAERAVSLAPLSVTIADSFADMLRDAGRNSDAVAAYEHCLSIRPKHYAALCALGELSMTMGQMTRARVFLEQAVEIRPRLDRAKRLLARLEADDAGSATAA